MGTLDVMARKRLPAVTEDRVTGLACLLHKTAILVKRNTPSAGAHLRLAGLIVLILVAMPASAQARLVVDRIVVRGTTNVTTRVLAARMHLYSGDTLDFALLGAAEQRLMESDLFSKVRVFIDLPTAEAVRRMYLDDATYPVEVVVEAVGKQAWFVFPTASLGSGDWAGGVVYANQNLLGRDVQLISAGQIGQSRSYAFVGYRDPLVVGVPLTYATSALYRREEIRLFANHSLVLQVPTTVAGGDAQIGWVLSPHTRALVGVSARYQAVEATADLAARHSATALQFPRRSYLPFAVSVPIRQHPCAGGLRQGILLLLKNEVSDRYWLSDFDYSKFEARVELYGHYWWNYPSVILKMVLNDPTSDHGVPVTEDASHRRVQFARLSHQRVPWRHALQHASRGSGGASCDFIFPGRKCASTSRRRSSSTPRHFSIAILAAPRLLPPDTLPSPARSKLDDIHASFGGGCGSFCPAW
jgi:hypothetical protein